MTNPKKPENTGRGWTLALYLILGGILLGAGVLYREELINTLYKLETVVQDLGLLGHVVLTVVASLWAILCLPGPIILGFLGTVYSSSPMLGLLVAVIADSVAEAFGFFAARHVGRRAIKDWLGKKPWFQWLDDQAHERGAYGVLVIRMMPFFPNSLANYAFGLSALRFWPYFIASVLGSIPNLAVYIFGTAGAVHFVRHGISANAIMIAAAVIFGSAVVMLMMQGFLRRHGRLAQPSDSND